MIINNIWRAIVEPSRNTGKYIERIYFVEAHGRMEATAKLINIVSSIDGVRPDSVTFYNLKNYGEMVEEGVSANHQHRLFETGWRGEQVANWVECPVFLVPDPDALKAIWMEATQPVEDGTP